MMGLRARTTDHLQGFRFHVTVADGFAGALQHAQPGDAVAGFQSVTVPEVTQDATEYREGHYLWTRKLPGVPTVSDITMQRGVTLGDSTFFDWLIRCVKGGEDYRVTLNIHHFSRGQTRAQALRAPQRRYVCYECFPLRAKAAGDLEATSSDVSLMEVDVSTEYMEVFLGDSATPTEEADT